MFKYTQTIRRQIADKLPTNCFSVFDHFVKLALKRSEILTVDMSTIIQRLQDMSRNGRFWMSEVEKFTFIFTCLKNRTWTHLFCFEARKNIPQVNYVPNNINLGDVANEFVDRKKP